MDFVKRSSFMSEVVNCFDYNIYLRPFDLSRREE